MYIHTRPIKSDDEMNKYIGLMSGTSLDAMDAVALRYEEDGTLEVLGNYSEKFDDEIRNILLEIQGTKEVSLEALMYADQKIAKLAVLSIKGIMNKLSVTSKDLHAIGFHGQTIYHNPKRGETLQIGNPAIVAEESKITTVANFRLADLAVKGEGAPLAPIFHRNFFSSRKRNRVVVNIGGIANITYLPAVKTNNTVIGFDTGPGNALLDYWIKKHKKKNYDDKGKWAKTGIPNQSLLSKLLNDPYFYKSAPKSTGKGYFSPSWLHKYLDQQKTFHLKPEDIQATLLHLTAVSITNAVKLYCNQVDEVILCGGGAHNNDLVCSVQHYLKGIKVFKSDELGVSVNQVEGATFALLAALRLRNIPGNLPSVTGASNMRVLGAVYQPTSSFPNVMTGIIDNFRKT